VDEALHKFGSSLSAILAELDWELLGRSYCEGDGSDFFDDELRASILDTGLLFADDIASALGGARGTSLYLGAELAELPVILAEHFVLGRKIEWLNLECAQTSEITRTLRAVGAKLGLELPLPEVRALSSITPGSCDHLWMVSVLTDPDGFPALHDELYERTGSELATGRGVLAQDRERAEKLVEDLLERSAPGCVLSTSDEERVLIEALVARRGWRLEFAEGGRLSAIVGDLVRIGRLRR